MSASPYALLLAIDAPLLSVATQFLIWKVGSGVANDTVAGDSIFSNRMPMRSKVAGESFGFQAVPVIGGQSTFADATLVQNAVRSYSTESGIVPSTKP
jgi:hypothetical protein